MLGEVSHGVAKVVEQQGGHILADSEADQNALDGDVGSRFSSTCCASQLSRVRAVITK